MPDIANRALNLITASQRENARIIEEVFREAGYPEALIAAAIVNAMAESSLDHLAVGDNGRSVGLFQLNDYGLGHDMTREERLDPRTNTLRIIDEIESSHGSRLRSLFPLYSMPFTSNIEALAQVFSDDIERPKDRAAARKKRVEITRWMFPNDVLFDLYIPPMLARPPKPTLQERLAQMTRPLAIAAGVATALAVARVWWVSRK